MQAAGRALAHAIAEDLAVAGVAVAGGPPRLLVLVGKGHNGGDALLATIGLLAAYPAATAEVGFVYGQNRLRPLAGSAWRALQAAGGERVHAVRRSAVAGDYTAVIDGVFGFQFRPPLAEPALGWLGVAADVSARLRAAVDLPSGLDGPGAFCADATYATGIFKAPLLQLPTAGRLRYLDLGFFRGDEPGSPRILTPGVLQPLLNLRPAQCDKRSFGHVAILGGSRSMPGAVGMSVAAALQSGVGLVTAFVPESVAAAFAARWPEAMWVACPETPDGGIAMESGLAIRTRLGRATALLVGPGLGREPETLALVGDLLRGLDLPVVLDADALQPELIGLGRGVRVFTPHQGELERIARGRPEGGGAGAQRLSFRPTEREVLVHKGAPTRIVTAATEYISGAGGPVLARGGSGDLLAGLIAGRLAATPNDPVLAAAQGVVWHGRAAHRVAVKGGEVAVRTTALLDELNPALRER